MRTCYLKVATFCSVALFLGACSKDTDIQPSREITQQRNPIEQLRKFRKQIERSKEHPGMRNQETIPLSEALWGVENNFNVTYSDPEQYYVQTNIHEFTIMVPVGADQKVLFNDVTNLYEQVTEEARQSLESDEFAAKGLVSLQIEQAEVMGEVAQLKFKAITGERCAYSPPTYYVDGPFDTDDNWMDSWPQGKCDDPDIPSGADKELQEKLFDELIGTMPEASPGQRNIFVDRKTFVFDGRDYPGIYLSDKGSSCIPYYRMNLLYHAEKSIITSTIPEDNHLNGYVPISIVIQCINPESENIITHFNEIVYGRPYRVNIDEFGEVRDLLNPDC